MSVNICDNDFYYDKSLEICSSCSLICDNAEQRRSTDECLSEYLCQDYYNNLKRVGQLSTTPVNHHQGQYADAIPDSIGPGNGQIITVIVLSLVGLFALLFFIYYTWKRSKNRMPDSEEAIGLTRVNLTKEEVGDPQSGCGQSTTDSASEISATGLTDLPPFDGGRQIDQDLSGMDQMRVSSSG